MSTREEFRQLVEEAYDKMGRRVGRQINRMMREMKEAGVEAAGEAYGTLTGLQFGPYVDGVRNRDYKSEIAGRLSARRIKVTEPREYKPDMRFAYVWDKFDQLERGRTDGVTAREVLQAIVYEEQAQGKAPSNIDVDAVTRKYLHTIAMVLGQLRIQGKPLEGINGRWKRTQYGGDYEGEDRLTEEDADYIMTRTLEVAEEMKQKGMYRWKSEQIWPEHPERVERFYEQVLNGGTVRDHEGIGMTLIKNPRTDRREPVYYWKDREGDFSQTRQKIFESRRGQVVASYDEEEGRTLIRDLKGERPLHG